MNIEKQDNGTTSDLLSFFYDFTHCPFCEKELSVNILANNVQSQNTEYDVILDKEKLLINIKTSRYLVDNKESFVQINLQNGHIIKSKTIYNFIDLYELSIQIRVLCTNGCVFMKKIYLSYDYKKSDFLIKKHSDGFSFTTNGFHYAFFNYYDDNMSKINKTSMHLDYFDATSVYSAPIINLKDFDYQIDNLASRLDNIIILL